MRKSLTRRERLRGRAALKRVFSFSRKSSCSGVRLLAVENGLDYNRVVFSPVRKFGVSVARNRARRVGKEAYRCIKSSIKPGFDLAFILFPGDFSYGERISQFSFLLKKAGLLCEE
jgi:ribonuclease P protein component